MLRSFFVKLKHMIFSGVSHLWATSSLLSIESKTRRQLNYILVGLLWMLYVLISSAEATPDLDKVVSGSVNVIESHNKLDVIQDTQKAIIDWRSFDIDVDEHTQFHHINSNAVTLNRVTGVDPSQILGRLSANGNIILINPNGVMFGADSKVDVNSLLATTANISNENFLKGKYLFDKAGNPLAKIVNKGEITVGESGFIGLIAPQVENSGVIKAKLAKVHLGAGDTFTLDMYGDGLFEIAVTDETVKKTVKNTGVIDAAGGEIYLTAAAGNNVADSLIEVEGELRAPAVSQKGGKIVIFAEGSNAVKNNVASNKGKRSGESKVVVKAKIDVSGKEEGQKGGKVQVSGDYVNIMYGSKIIASGHSGGGKVYVGGDYLGGSENNSKIPTAKNTFVDENTTIDVSANTSGDAGKAIIWADENTSFKGEVLAKGGELSGDGGFVEVSGKRYLDFRGDVDTSAANGEYGELLLDPGEIVICQFSGGCPGAPSLTASGNTFNSGANNGISYVDIGSVGAVGTLLDLLNSNNVTVRTNAAGTGTGNITVQDQINSTSNRRLTLRAHGAAQFFDDVTVRNLDVFSSDVVINPGVTLQSNNNNGLLRFFQFTNGLSFGIGDSATGDISFSSAEIDQLSNWGRIEFGNNNLAADINIGDVTFDADLVLRTTQKINIVDDLTVTTNDYMRFYSNDIDVLGNLTGTNVVEFYQQNNATTMGVGDGATGSYFLSTAELNRIQDGFREIRIGNSVNNANLQIAGHSWTDRVRFSNRNGVMSFIGAQNFTENVLIMANNLDIQAALNGAANKSLTIRARDASRESTFGGVGDVAGQLTVESSEIAHINNKNWRNLIIGHSNGSADLNLNSASWTGSNVTFYTRNGSINVLGNKTFGQNATFIGNNMQFDADIVGTQNLIIRTRDAARNTVLGGTTAGYLSLEANEIARVNNKGWSNITIGHSRNDSILDVNALTWSGNSNIKFFSRDGYINILGAQNFGSNQNLTIEGNNVEISADVNGGDTFHVFSRLNNRAYTIGGNVEAANTLALKKSEVEKFSNGTWNNVRIGQTDDSGLKTVNDSTFAGNNEIISRAGDIKINEAINVGSGEFKITTRSLSIDDTISGTGKLIINPNGNIEMGIGTGQTGGVQLSDTEVANIQDGFSTIEFGRTNMNANINVGANTWNDNVSFINANREVRFNGTQNFGANDVLISSNRNVRIDNPLIGTGNLTLQTSSVGSSIGVGGAGGNLNINDADLANIQDGWNQITIGRTDGTGRLRLDSTTFNDNVILQTGTGEVRVDRAVTSAGGSDLTIITNGNPLFGSAASLSGTGSLTIKTQSPATSIGLAGGAGTLNLTTTELDKIADGWNMVSFGDSNHTGGINVGSYTNWKDQTKFITAAAGNTNINGNQEAVGDGSLQYDSSVVLMADVGFKAATGDITFNQSVNGTQNLTLETAGDIIFNGTVGAINALIAVVVNNVDDFTANGFTASTFTQNAGTGQTSFNATGLNASGDINITNTSGIFGVYSGDNGSLTSTAGAINSTVTFETLDIDSQSANLLAGRIGTSGEVNQEMANLISIKGVKFPSLVPVSIYKFAGFVIGVKPVRSTSSFDGALKDVEDGFTFLQENDNDNQDVFGTSFEDVKGGQNCSRLFYNSESCGQSSKNLFKWQKQQ